MRFILSNIAKVKSADVEIAGITVIAGYNNTGKTTILKSIDALLQTFTGMTSQIESERGRSIHVNIQKKSDVFDLNGFEAMPFELLNNLSDEVTKFIRENKGIKIEKFKEIYLNILDSYSMFYKEIENYEEMFSDEFVLSLFDGIEEICQRENSTYLEYIATRNVRQEFGQQAHNFINGQESKIECRREDFPLCKLTFMNNKAALVVGKDLGDASVIYLETRNVLDTIDKRNAYDGLQQYLQKTLKNDKSFEEYSEIERNIGVLQEIFEDVLHGKLQNDSNGLKYSEEGIEELIGIRNVASGMKTLLMLQRLVENGTLRRNSWLLIDEPESNLHPEWHLKLAEILTLMRKKIGANIIVSSHSPYFMRALEIKMAAHDMKDVGRFYLMKQSGDMYEAENVTDCTEKIYEQLYKPLEEL